VKIKNSFVTNATSENAFGLEPNGLAAMSAAALEQAAAPHGRAPYLEQFDWSKTPLGPMAQWPQLLKTAAQIMQSSACPIVILWGKEGHLVYNAAYADFASDRHPAILGRPVKEAWPEAVPLNQHVLDACFAGESVQFRAEYVPLRRHGQLEDVWLDIDYSPICGPDGAAGGVWCNVSEVTATVLADKRRAEIESQLALAIEAADIATWDYDLKNGVYFVSPRLEAMFWYPPGGVKNREQLTSLIHPHDRGTQARAWDHAISPHGDHRYVTEFRIVSPHDGSIRWVATLGRAFFDEHGAAIRLAGSVLDVTARKNAERRQACLVELGDRLRAAETTAEIAQIAAEIAGRALNTTRAGYAMIENDVAFVEADWTNGDSVSLAGPRLFGSLGDPFCDPLRAGTCLMIDDVRTHPTTRHNPAPFLRINMAALINVPLLENGQICAVFYVHQDAPRRWDEDELRLARDIGDRTWEAFCRARSTHRLRALNETLEQEIAQRTAQRDRMWRLSSDVMLVTDFSGQIESANPAWKTLFGWDQDELIGRSIYDFTHPDDREDAAKAFALHAWQHAPVKVETRHRHRDGSYLYLSWRTAAGELSIHAVGRDITAEREQGQALQAAEAALRQAQKMEAVGQLTGGIAHDFNNLLQGITGSLDLAEIRLSQSRTGDVEKFLAAARASCSRAAALTHRLLAFSRRQPLDPKPVAANPLIASMDDLLRRTTGEHIEIELRLDAGLWLTLCDPNQLESAILNLAINARDAMPDGGRLTIETTNTEISVHEAASRPELKPGPYICVAVTDTGCGMPESVIAQAFDPFYTTKPIGQGTGLGLSMIYGFIRQSEGDARIFSELGQGTTVKLFLPRHDGAAPAPEPAATAPGLQAGGHATVLVVEDEDIVRGLVNDVLSDLGLTVIEAATGQAGLDILSSKQQVDLLITDIGLPGLNGRQMADAARLLRPNLKILFMTGYAEIAVSATNVLEQGMAMITKPFTISALADRVRAMIESE
jgi:PAS domain S-box-containing protein